jgi:hypothetical protein
MALRYTISNLSDRRRSGAVFDFPYGVLTEQRHTVNISVRLHTRKCKNRELTGFAVELRCRAAICLSGIVLVGYKSTLCPTG